MCTLYTAFQRNTNTQNNYLNRGNQIKVEFQYSSSTVVNFSPFLLLFHIKNWICVRVVRLFSHFLFSIFHLLLFCLLAHFFFLCYFFFSLCCCCCCCVSLQHNTASLSARSCAAMMTAKKTGKQRKGGNNREKR